MKNSEKLLFSVMLLLLTGCSVPKESVIGNSISASRVESMRVDSVFIRDSIFIKEKSDTVFYTKYRTVYKEMFLRDTVAVCDTIYSEKVVTLQGDDDSVFQWWVLLLALFLFWKSDWIGRIITIVRNLLSSN